MRTDCKKSSFIILATIFFALAILCFAFLAKTELVSAADETENSITVKPVKHPSECIYKHFDYPTYVYAADGEFTVIDGKNAYTYNVSNTAKEPLLTELPIENVKKFAVCRNMKIMLSDGFLQIEGEQFNNITDFAVIGGTVFAINGDENGSLFSIDLDASNEQQTLDIKLLTTYGSSIGKITADSSGIYASTANTLNRYLDDVIYFSVADNAIASSSIRASALNRILDIASTARGIATLSRDGITAYESGEDELLYYGHIDCDDAVAISASGNTVYGISELKSVFKTDADFTERKEIIASAYDAKGFFRSNAGLTTRKNMIAVADELNNRVQIIRENATETVTEGIFRPKAVAIDYFGDIYVAHSQNKISVYSGDTFTCKRTFAADNLGSIIITSLKIDSDNNLYALAKNGQVYKANGVFEAIGGADVKAIASSQTSNSVYVATSDNRIRELGKTATVVKSEYAVADFCTDYYGNIYVLTTDGNIAKYEKGSTSADLYKQTSDLFINATAIEMNTVNFKGDIPLNYGDILISDTGAHSVLSINGKSLEVNKGLEITDKAEEVSAERTEYDSAANEIIFTVHATELYPMNMEINALKTTLTEGMKVIIPNYDANANFNYIVADNLEGGAGEDVPQVTGWIHKSFIKEKFDYKESKTQTCYSFTSLKVYKFPTYNSPVVDSHPKDTKYQLLNFVYSDKDGGEVYGYTDNRNTLWYRVSYKNAGDDTVYEGYVNGAFIRLRGGIPNDSNIYPRTNATIISLEKGKNIPAPLFEKENGKMVQVRDDSYPPLAVGTKVEVVGTFDSSEEFTLINYYHEGMGKTVQLYVYTANLEYDGLNMVVVIAVIIIILTAILGVILIARVLYVKRTRKLNGETKI